MPPITESIYAKAFVAPLFNTTFNTTDIVTPMSEMPCEIRMNEKQAINKVLIDEVILFLGSCLLMISGTKMVSNIKRLPIVIRAKYK